MKVTIDLNKLLAEGKISQEEYHRFCPWLYFELADVENTRLLS
ncbi:hypothetical protein [Candidatus Electronema sp. PJ]